MYVVRTTVRTDYSLQMTANDRRSEINGKMFLTAVIEFIHIWKPI